MYAGQNAAALGRKVQAGTSTLAARHLGLPTDRPSLSIRPIDFPPGSSLSFSQMHDKYCVDCFDRVSVQNLDEGSHGDYAASFVLVADGR